MSPRRLQVSLAKPGKADQDYPPLTLDELQGILSGAWRSEAEAYLYVHDGQENIFLLQAESQAFEVMVRVKDKFGLLGMLGKQQVLELPFGLLSLEDAQRLLKLFYEDNYPALRSLHRQIQAGP